ncbi:MAG: trigger factor [Actinomycetota bacterium]|jgi:trigger factor|nr:trigger factor [Actinomycetota bacterium]
MKADVAPLEGNKVKLSVEVDEDEVERAIDETFDRLTKELIVPGFRRGKVPRRVLEARLGRPRARQEALDRHLPEWYERAVNDKSVDVIADPEVEVTAGQEEGAVAFDAVVEVRPRLELQGYKSLEVKVPSPLVSEEDVQAQVDRLRGNFAELAIVEREARTGDSVVIDMVASRDGKPLPGLSYTDYSVELGSGDDLPGLDEHIPGAKAGDTVVFDTDVGGPVHVEVRVKQVQEKVLPEETDEWASEASEFTTVAELRDDIRKRLSTAQRARAAAALRDGTWEALVGLVTEDPPAVLVDAETRRMAETLGRRLDSQGIALQRYLNAVGTTLEQVVAEMRAQAVPAVKADLALRAVADDLGIEPSEAEMDEFMEGLARQAGVSLEVFRGQVERAGQRRAVRSDLKKSKAFDWLVGHVEVTDEEGNPVDRALLTAEEEAPGAGSSVAGSEAGTPFAGAAGGPASLELAGSALAPGGSGATPTGLTIAGATLGAVTSTSTGTAGTEEGGK